MPRVSDSPLRGDSKAGSLSDQTRMTSKDYAVREKHNMGRYVIGVIKVRHAWHATGRPPSCFNRAKF